MADQKTQWKESLSIEETNKIRISLGLKPLSTDAPAKTEDALAQENYEKQRAAERAEHEQAALKARIDKARNTKERAKKLVGVGLGAADRSDTNDGAGLADDADTKAWVRRQKKQAKELAAKRAKELEEQERLAQEQGVPKYDENDLAGIKVAHGEQDFDEGEDTILTLKDSRILDDQDDELHNINLSERKKAAEAVELKKKGRQAGQYTGYDDDEFDPANIGGQRSVLKKYDEEIMGKPEEGFRLGAAVPSGKASSDSTNGRAAAEGPAERERVKLSMHYAKTFNTDYLQEGEAGFKIKKKKKRATRAKDAVVDEDAEPSAMDVDGAAAPPQIAIERKNLDDANLIDDDDLQASLARQRREANKKRVAEIKARAAANVVARERQDSMDVDNGFSVKQESDDEGVEVNNDGRDVLVLDDTSEFVRNIQLAAARPPAPKTNGVVVKKEEGTESVMPMIKREQEDVPLDELVTSRDDSAMEQDDDDEQEEGLVQEELDVKPKVEDDDAALGTQAEATVSKGLASTLSLLRHQGLIKPRTPEEIERERVIKEREAWLAKKRQRDEEREADRIASRQAGASKDQAQREYENRMRDQREAQEALESFKNYKPNVNLEYRDEFGRALTAKEAWKQLTHQFHGKHSGSKKTEKRLAKIAAEQKALAMASGDTPLSTAAAFQARAERTGSATMVLSVGNKGSAPIPDASLENLSKSNGKKDVKGKGKASLTHTRGREGSASAAASSSNPVFNDIPMRPIPIESHAPGTAVARSESPAVESSSAPPKRAGFRPVGFAPIGQASPVGTGSASPASRADSPAGGGGDRMTIPLQVKRKAVDELNGAPNRKR
ncbi:hypothetical protein OIV83_006245 [Microbotryomycetes sp. JL201]|nr:hypothetical protein OIV83_006245 [Microbotryomycetes sp. JL201]